MSFLKTGFSAIGKLIALAVLAAVFLFGMATVVYMSLQGAEIKVPEITGKSFSESETELASLGLKIKKRADRVSAEPPNTIIEQLPRPGETVKTGQLILVVTSKAPASGEELPKTIPTTDEDDSDKIEEMITDKPKKTKTNTNTNRKKADTARDVNTETSNSNSNSADSNSNKKEPGSNNNSTDKTNKNSTAPGNKQTGPAGTTRPAGGDTKPRTTTRPNR
ncbi:MAG: PASTA domain-containing protein [Acidobacteria bacterium]|nr:PASTA domain-containing protein [Acidobacteriota bacterium]